MRGCKESEREEGVRGYKESEREEGARGCKEGVRAGKTISLNNRNNDQNNENMCMCMCICVCVLRLAQLCVTRSGSVGDMPNTQADTPPPPPVPHTSPHADHYHGMLITTMGR